MASLPVALTGHPNERIIVKQQSMDAYGATSTTTVVWTTDTASVAIVQGMSDNSGAVISCIAAGTATITATAGAVTATFVVTVSVVSPGATATLVVSADHSYQPVKRMF